MSEFIANGLLPVSLAFLHDFANFFVSSGFGLLVIVFGTFGVVNLVFRHLFHI